MQAVRSSGAGAPHAQGAVLAQLGAEARASYLTHGALRRRYRVAHILRARRDTAQFKLVVFATIAIAIGYTITFVFNVPVNNQLEIWSADAPPANAREIRSQWEKAHVARTIFWALGFFLETLALAYGSERHDEV